jgi:HAD superfamily hydrolase (TIGR01509 family)
MPPCVLFDFDGVVVQSELLHKETFMELLAPYGVSVDIGRWYREFAGTGSRHIFEVLVKERGIKADVDAMVEERKRLYEARVRSGHLKLTPGAREFLSSLRSNGVKTAIVSGSHRTNVKAALETLELSGFFDIIVSGDDMQERKPDPAPYLRAAKMLSISPGDCVVIEDSVAGCEAARRAGMKLIVMESPALPYVGKYDIEIKDFSGKSLIRLKKSGLIPF